jgi:hypothetical protein
MPKGVPPNKHYQFASKINWLHYQLLGAISNIHSATYQISYNFSISDLKTDRRIQLQLILQEVETAVNNLKRLRAQIAEFNKLPNKYKVKDSSSL